MKIDKDNIFLKISGNSEGLAGNQFLHLFILYRRTDSNEMPGEWNYDHYYMSDADPCTVYKDGSWECRIRLDEQYAEWVNGTLVVKSPNNPSNNISTNVDIVAIITKQSVGHSILTKLETGVFHEEISDHSWYKIPIVFCSALRKGTFHDENYELVFGSRVSRLYLFEYSDYRTLPKHLADAHVTITPLITEPFNLTGNPHRLLVSVYPSSIPADNVTDASVTVQLIDSAGNYLQSGGWILNLTCTKGNLSTTHVITNSKGKGIAYITSGELGESSILVQSAGLNNGTCQITYTLPPVVVEFNQWVMSSPENNETSELTANFQTMHDAKYCVALTGWGTEAHWPFMPEEWPIVRVEVDGIALGDIEVTIGSSIYLPIGNVQLNAGNHTLRVNMTNNLAVPLVGERNLYVERVKFY